MTQMGEIELEAVHLNREFSDFGDLCSTCSSKFDIILQSVSFKVGSKYRLRGRRKNRKKLESGTI